MAKRSAQARRWRRDKTRKSDLRTATWNVRSLVESEGDIQTAAIGGKVAEDKKIVRIVQILKSRNIDIAGLQETHWFGADTYQVQDRVIITSGRPVPGENAPNRRRGEGVAIVLNKFTADAWRCGGCTVNAVSSRMLTARLKFIVQDGRTLWMRVIVAYAPTFASKRSEKDAFYNDLQNALSSVEHGEEYIILGDFNARVGSRVGYDDWSGVRGPHGFGKLNSSGEEFLSFLAMNEAMICNTWFQKKDKFKQTWQHPRTKQWHCIDYIAIPQKARHRCIDSQVIVGAECGSDHSLVYMRFRLDLRRMRTNTHRPTSKKVHPYNVGVLRPNKNTDPNGEQSRAVVREFQSTLQSTLQTAAGQHQTDNALDELNATWCVLRDSIVSSADTVIGHCTKKQPDWYAESSTILDPLLKTRTDAYNDWVAHGKRDDVTHVRFKAARKAARSAIRNAKNTWFASKASIIENARFNGEVIWKNIRALCRGCAGLQPVNIHAVRDEEGNICSTTEAQQQRWCRHFTKVLNVRTSFNPEILSECVEREPAEDMDGCPDLEEISIAISQLSNGKAAGESRIIPELIKAGGDVLAMALTDLMSLVWQTEEVPQDWINSMLVTLPKKGDLSICDNWRGIALLDVVGKVVARVLQSRLQRIAEEVLPDSQCGFRRNRSCTDMIFAVRQIHEKVIEHRSKAFCVFIDLKKAYDSVPRDGLWSVLQRLGVPPKLTAIIKAFHTDMSTRLRLDGGTSEPIEVRNGLRQGCCMAPVLFNLYMCAVVEVWCSRMADVDDVGIQVKSNFDGCLMRKARQPGSYTKITESQFADDSALFATSRAGAEKAIDVFNSVANEFGLTVSFTKTKFMVMGPAVHDDDTVPIAIANSVVECVNEFKYLGSTIDVTGRCTTDVKARVAAASKAFGALRRPVFRNCLLSVTTKRYIFSACVLSLLLYGSECWVLLQADIRYLTTFYLRCVRSILGMTRRDTWRQHLSTKDMLRLWGDERPLAVIIRQRRLEWLGHVSRMEDDRMPRRLLFGILPITRPPGGPKKRWRDAVTVDLRELDADQDWYAVATESRADWRQLYRAPAPDPVVNRTVECEICHRQFKSRAGLGRHKCLAERMKPIQDQAGAVKCDKCQRWFRSAGGKAVHVCRVSTDRDPPSTQVHAPTPTCCKAHCSKCQRCFKSSSGHKRHKCNAVRRHRYRRRVRSGSTDT